MIRAEEISFNVDGTRLLDRVSLDLRHGEVTAILGPNGAGKSTLLKCLAGTHVPSSGQVLLDGRDLAAYGLLDLARRRAVLTQSVQVSFPFNVREIVAMGRAPFKGDVDGTQDTDIIRGVLEQVDAWHLRDRIFPTLSGGEQQRVQLARVLAQSWNRRHAHLLLDEPTSALDLKHQHQVLQRVQALAREEGYAVCFVIHDLNLARIYADRAVLLERGRVSASGSTSEVLTATNIETVFEISADLVFPKEPPEAAAVSGHL